MTHSPAFSPIPRRRLYQEVAERLEAMIRDGALAEGEALPSERELMERFGVGRPAIREALLSLQQKGLIAIGNGERARVVHPDAAKLIDALSGAARVYLGKEAGVRHFQGARLLFESAIAAEAARLASEEDLARIGAALEANRAARGNRALFQSTDVAFHLEIVRTTRNPLLVGVHQALTDWLTEQREVSLLAPEAEASALSCHERIFAALAAHDAEAAASEMRAHLTAVERFYWQHAHPKPNRRETP